MTVNKFMTLISGIPRLVAAISSSSGVANAFDVIATNALGRLDPTFLPTNVELNGYRPIVPVPGNKTLAASDVNTCQVVSAAATITIPTDAVGGSSFTQGAIEFEFAINTTGAVVIVQPSGGALKYRNAAGTVTTGNITAAGDASFIFVKRIGANSYLATGATT